MAGLLPPKLMLSVMRTPIAKANIALKIREIFFWVAVVFRMNSNSDGLINPIIRAIKEAGNRMKMTKKLKMMRRMNIARHKKEPFTRKSHDKCSRGLFA
jgi:hypothetical protein